MNLELYYFPECPYCQRVLHKIDELGVQDKITLRNIFEDRNAYEKHVRLTGRKTVPCLYIDDQPMFESADINQWLEENL